MRTSRFIEPVLALVVGFSLIAVYVSPAWANAQCCRAFVTFFNPTGSANGCSGGCTSETCGSHTDPCGKQPPNANSGYYCQCANGETTYCRGVVQTESGVWWIDCIDNGCPSPTVCRHIDETDEQGDITQWCACQ